MSAWPRVILPQSVTDFEVPGALQSVGQTGRAQYRSTQQIGRVWTETYPPFKAQEADGRAFLAMIRDTWRSGASFTIEHYLHRTKLGGGTGTPRVNGVSLTGSSLPTDGWTGTNPVLKAGDLFLIAGITSAFEVTADAPNLSAGATTLSISPPIFAGASPADNALLTITSVLLSAHLAGPPQIPNVGPDEYVAGLTLTFREDV